MTSKQNQTAPVPSDLEMVKLVRCRPGMYFKGGFDSLVAFFDGYSLAVGRLTGHDPMRDAQEWAKTKYRREFSLYWPYYLLNVVAKGDEQTAMELFFTTLEESLQRTASGR